MVFAFFFYMYDIILKRFPKTCVMLLCVFKNTSALLLIWCACLFVCFGVCVCVFESHI